MRLEHDNTGSNPDWKVDYVSMMGHLTIKQGWHDISGISVGKLTKVRLEHDNTGSNPDWKVDYVSMMDQLTI